MELNCKHIRNSGITKLDHAQLHVHIVQHCI